MRKIWFFDDLSISKVFDEDEEEVILCKAYLLDEVDDILSFQMDNDYLSISPEAAAQWLIYQTLSKAHTKHDDEQSEENYNVEEFVGKRIVILFLKIAQKELRMNAIWRTEEHQDKIPMEWHGTSQVDLHTMRFSATQIKQYLLEDVDVKYSDESMNIALALSEVSK